MKLLTLILFSTLLTGLASCQTKPVKTVFETTQKDSATRLNETKIYTLKKQTENSDFNYSKLDDIDSNKMDTLNVRNLMPVFEPVSGQYKYYQFLSTFVVAAGRRRALDPAEALYPARLHLAAGRSATADDEICSRTQNANAGCGSCGGRRFATGRFATMDHRPAPPRTGYSIGACVV